MTNEMKLLQALCKALGFHVETIIDRQERKENKIEAMRYNRAYIKLDRRLQTTGPMGALDIDENGLYTSYLINPVISYKLTKMERSDGNEGS